MTDSKYNCLKCENRLEADKKHIEMLACEIKRNDEKGFEQLLYLTTRKDVYYLCEDCANKIGVYH